MASLKPLEPKTLKLKKPIVFGSQTISELKFRIPNASDLRELPVHEDKPFFTNLWLAGRLCGQSDAEMDMLEGDDLEEVIAIAAGFMPRVRKAGSTP